MRNSALQVRGRRTAKDVLRSQKSLVKAVSAAIEPLEARQLLSAGSQIGSTTVTESGVNERGGFVIHLEDQSLIQVGSVGTCGDMQFAFATFDSSGNRTSNNTFGLPGDLTITGHTICTINAATLVQNDPDTTADDKIVVVGSVNHQLSLHVFDQDLMVAQFSINGAFDSAFGKPTVTPGVRDGVTTTDTTPIGAPGPNSEEAFAVAVDDDGKVVVSGNSGQHFIVARYTSQGDLDSSFGTVVDAVPEPDLRAGYASNAFGVSLDQLHSMAIQADGKIVLAGSTTTIEPVFVPTRFALQRYTVDGDLDSSFGDGGNVIETNFVGDSQIFAVAVDTDGRILAAGEVNFAPEAGYIPTFTVARYTSGGDLDTTFNLTGYNILPFLSPADETNFVVDGELRDVAIQADGKIVAAGPASYCDGIEQACVDGMDAAMVAIRYNSNGTIDTDFGASGFAAGEVYQDAFPVGLNASIAIQTDVTTQQQTLVVGGNIDSPSQFVLSRFDLDVVASTGSFTPALNGPSTANEGDLVTFQGSVTGGGSSSATFLQWQRRAVGATGDAGSTNYSWTVKRGATLIASGSGTVASGGSFNFSFTPDDNGTYHVKLTVDNGTGPAEADVAVSNVAPSVAISGPTSGVRGFSQSYTSTVNDPGAADTFTYAWTAKKGAVVVATGSATTFSFTPSDTGTYVVSLTVTDDDNGSGSDSKNLTITSSGVVGGTLEVGGTGGNDDITIKPSGSGVSVDQNGSSNNYSGFSQIVVMGGNGNDSIKVNPNVNQSVAAFGGAGDDSIKGGGGNDILIGGDGNDLLQGQAGRDVLIGGDGQDHIVGQTDDDILVAGYSNYDSDLSALNSILAEWVSSRSYGQRSANIIGHNITIGATTYTFGGARNNGSTFLTPYDSAAPSASATVFDDQDVDVLTGSSGQDLFLFNAEAPFRDTITDLASNEFAADIDFITMVP